MRRSESLWSLSIWRTMARPKPLPPLPCICPSPTCVNICPDRSAARSATLRPAPVSVMATCTNWKPGTLPSSSVALRKMLPPAGVNFVALDMPLPKHWSRRCLSPIKRRSGESSGAARGLTFTSMPLVRARLPKVRSASSRRSASENGACSSSRRPESILSKSSMSETMCSISREQLCTVPMARSTRASPRVVASGRLASISARLCTVSSGLLRSCMTTLMSLLRAVAATSVALCFRCKSTSCSLRRLHSSAAEATDLWRWKSARSARERCSAMAAMQMKKEVEITASRLRYCSVMASPGPANVANTGHRVAAKMQGRAMATCRRSAGKTAQQQMARQKAWPTVTVRSLATWMSQR
mmetsp:Transcript_5168/g.15360  ORF Transcript_5168/g.15360 Transcript_5168/m.15360 type:complete len:356 (+) Transcript_5168:1351-2418(+)